MLQGIVDEIVREHVQLAAFQWAQHRTLSQAYPPDQAAAGDIDARLRANLDAIEIAGDAAWPFILDQFEDFPEAGELFVAAYLAMVRGDRRRIDQSLWMAHQHPRARSGLAGALAWFPPDLSAPTVRRMLDAESAVQRAVALDVLAAHGADAGHRLVGFLKNASAMVRASACTLAAATGRADCAAEISKHASAPDPDLRLAAASALARLGRTDAAFVPLKTEIEGGGPHSLAALRRLSETSEATDFRTYLGDLYQCGNTRSLAVRGIGMTGDRGHLDWLIGQMEVRETAVAAGESFLELFPEALSESALFTFA
ncbi:MAG: hypothetical protein WBB85_07610, partial [Albidovulum sp.]|uniref:hypothetical protein n=1 Tax=Albidovulum sp. TaxID=1872424 RepID=UPI003CA41163